MLIVLLILIGLSVVIVSGVPAFFLSSSSKIGQRITVALFITGSLIGLFGAFMSFGTSAAPALNFPWFIPWGEFSVTVDKLSAFFLIPVFIITVFGSLYSLGYWKQSEHTETGQKLGFFYGLLSGSIALVVISHDGVLFLIAWEFMALAAFFCLTTEDHKKEIREAGFIYFVCAHIGTLILFILFVLWKINTGAFTLEPIVGLPVKTAGIIFLIVFVGFSLKAGFMLFHIWLPGAHATAPSHVSAIMSAVLLKMGIYGIIRFSGLLTVCEPWWGTLLLVFGAITGLLGIIFAFSQTDFKRILAYSSIENIGIIGMGIGLALIGRAYAKPEIVLLGMSGALFHVWNHSVFKALLFFNSGAIIHATGTRDIELMGGLSKKMPMTSLLFIIGAVAISALPPLNGFASEWLIYLGFFKFIPLSGISDTAFVGFAAVALAMIGTIAVAVFVKMYSIVFLGSARSNMTDHAHDPALTMQISMIILSIFCFITGVFPLLVTPFLEGAVSAWIGSKPVSISELVPIQFISVIGILLIVLTTVIAVWQIKINKKRGITWDCGYAEPTAKMQYTGTSFAQNITKIFSFILLPDIDKHSKLKHFPEKSKFKITVADIVLNKILLPFFYFAQKMFSKVYFIQQGQPNLYVLYVIIMLLLMFIFSGIGVDL